MERDQRIDRAGLDVRRISPAYRQVAEQLRGLVLRGELAPGERLPNEAALSTMFGVSRSTVREALRVLSSAGLITTSRGVSGGHFVAHPQLDEISEFLEASLGLLSGSETVTVAELLEARALFEVPAARLAAQRRSAGQLHDLEQTLRHEQETLTRGDGFEDHRRFHQAILTASGNSLLEMVTRPIFTVLRNRFLRDEAPRSFWREVVQDHQRIYDAIATGDAADAAALMDGHLARLATTYERIDRRARRGPEVSRPRR